MTFDNRLLQVVGLVALAALAGSCGDDGESCTDPCDAVGDVRCFGPVIQRCWEAPNGCLLWGDETDCGAQGLLCLTPPTGPECGRLCTDPCSTGQSRCLGQTWQTCEEDTWGCFDWEDYADCAASALVCDDATGDASCYAP